MTAHLRPLDLAIVAAYLIAITLFGLRFREKKSPSGTPQPSRSLQSYFLANNTIPWWAIALSIVSAETSTLTIISIPGVAFAGDFGFLQVVLGYMLGRVVVAALFLPRYFSGSMLTAYQLIDQRFGHVLHKVTAGLFLLTRAAAEGVRVFAVSIVVGLAIGTRDTLSIAIISTLTLLYTFEGGMAAVIWTDVVQMAIYIGGTFVAIWSLGHHVPGGWSHIVAIAAPAGKFHMFNFALNLTTAYTFWAGVLGGTFLTMASHGTDQLMVQRLLAARSLRESRLALLSSGVVIFMQFTLFLLIGVGLYVFYGLHPGTLFRTNDYIFPTFIVRELPLGLAGLLVAAILAAAMSNLSAALNSLSSTTVVDFYMRVRPLAADRERNLIAKSSTVLWAIVLFAIAIYSLRVGGKGHVVEIGLSIASVAYGCLLGVFLLGTLTRFATEIGTSIGMLCGFALNLWLWQGTFPIGFWQTGPRFIDCKVTGGKLPDLIGSCPPPTYLVTIPHIAFTWYVIIGAIVTFAIGSLCSLIFRKQSTRSATIFTASLLLCSVILSGAMAPSAIAQSKDPDEARLAHTDHTFSTENPPQPDFSQVSQLITTAIAAHKLPGAVVLIGHNNQVVFEHAYGDRKLAGEPGLDGKPSPAEPMTEDTIFDMASLTKDLATATAIMQLYDAGKIASFDDPVEKYLPAFNETHDPMRSKVTLRMLLTHTSGEAPDIPLKDTWGLAAPDRDEGIHRALTTPLKAIPGTVFTYSDINFILLGDLVETLSGQREDDYAREHIFLPLGMIQTTYHPFDRTCGPVQHIGANTVSTYNPRMGRILFKCVTNTWQPGNDDIAPTAHDNEGTAATNPDFDHLLRGTVHDPTTRRMGGVAGHAGVFATAHDVSLFASALLEKLIHNTGPFPVKQSTLQLMTTPQQPSALNSPNDGFRQVQRAGEAEAVAIKAGDKPSEPGLAPHYPAIKDQNLRGFGWDIDTAFSKPRGALFPIGTFGHTGFTGTSLWMDQRTNTYVILLANAIHPRGGNGPISNLRGEVATAAAKALNLYPCGPTPMFTFADCVEVPAPSKATSSGAKRSAVDRPAGVTEVPTSSDPLHRISSTREEDTRIANTKAELKTEYEKWLNEDVHCMIGADPEPVCTIVHADGTVEFTPHTLTGIDVLESTNFTPLTEALAPSCSSSKLVAEQKPCRLGILTNQTGLDANGHRTIDILIANHYPLTTLFTPEHGLSGKQDTENLLAETDPATHLPIVSLYGNKPADRHPTHDQLKDLDAVLIDLQDAGVHFWTYEAAAGYFLEAAALEKSQFHHNLQIIVLDRPNPVGGLAIQGPISDPGTESYVNYMPLPIRHGLTLGELLRYANATKHLNASLTVIPMQHWSRTEYFAQTGLPWVNPSPNLRSPDAAILYPALGLIETTNISVGRGTSHPFSFFGAGIPPTKPSKSTATGGLADGGAPTTTGAALTAWFRAIEVADYLTARHIPGVTFTPTSEPITDDANHYPFHGQTIPAVQVTLTDPQIVDTPELGIEILAVLHKLYPTQFQLARVKTLLCNQSTLDALTRGDDPRDIAATWQPSLTAFRSATAPFLLYK